MVRSDAIGKRLREWSTGRRHRQDKIESRGNAGQRQPARRGGPGVRWTPFLA